MRELKSRPGRDIVVTGSITLTHALVTAGLVDEYRFFVYPTVQGRRPHRWSAGCGGAATGTGGTAEWRSGPESSCCVTGTA